MMGGRFSATNGSFLRECKKTEIVERVLKVNDVTLFFATMAAFAAAFLAVVCAVACGG